MSRANLFQQKINKYPYANADGVITIIDGMEGKGLRKTLVWEKFDQFSCVQILIHHKIR